MYSIYVSLTVSDVSNVHLLYITQTMKRFLFSTSSLFSLPLFITLFFLYPPPFPPSFPANPLYFCSRRLFISARVLVYWFQPLTILWGKGKWLLLTGLFITLSQQPRLYWRMTKMWALLTTTCQTAHKYRSWLLEASVKFLSLSQILIHFLYAPPPPFQPSSPSSRLVLLAPSPLSSSSSPSLSFSSPTSSYCKLENALGSILLRISMYVYTLELGGQTATFLLISSYGK